PLENTELPSGACLPDMDRSVSATRGNATAIRAQLEPRPAPVVLKPGSRPFQNQSYLFTIGVPDADQAIGRAFGKSPAVAGPRHGARPRATLPLPQGSHVLVRERIELDPLPAAAFALLALGNPFGEQFPQMREAAVFLPRLPGQVHLCVIEIL